MELNLEQFSLCQFATAVRFKKRFTFVLTWQKGSGDLKTLASIRLNSSKRIERT